MLFMHSMPYGKDNKMQNEKQPVKKILCTQTSARKYLIIFHFSLNMFLTMEFFCFYRTHCVNENEEEQTNKEIQMMFPNYADADFGDYTNSANLEKEIVKAPLKSEIDQNITDNDLKFIANTFNRVLFYNSRYS